MKILLIDPPIRRFTGVASFFFPTSLAYLAAPLKNTNHKVLIYDVDRGDEVPNSLDFNNSYNQMQRYVNAINESANPVWKEVTNTLLHYKPDLVGITAMTTKIASAMKIAELVKEYNSNCHVVMGGPHPTIGPDDILKSGSVDFICRNEGEESFHQLVDALDRKTSSDYLQSPSPVINQIKGISFKENGRIIHNDNAMFIDDLDSIPYPARESLMNQRKYSSEDIGMILTSRGCPYRCSYCFHPFGSNSVKYRSVDNILGEIEEIKKMYGSYHFSFKDDSFTVKRSHVMELCEALIKNKTDINWDCTTRVNLVDREMLKIMKIAGCNVIKVGVESGSKRILEDTNKGITHEQIRNAARLFNDLGIFWSAYFMIGLPQETEEDMQQTYEFMKEIDPFYAGLGVYNPFPETELFNLGVKMGILKEEIEFEDFKQVNPIDYYFINPAKRVAALNKDEFEKISARMMGAFNNHNKKFAKLARRGWERRKQYVHDPRMIKNDVGKVLSWIWP